MQAADNGLEVVPALQICSLERSVVGQLHPVNSIHDLYQAPLHLMQLDASRNSTEGAGATRRKTGGRGMSRTQQRTLVTLSKITTSLYKPRCMSGRFAVQTHDFCQQHDVQRTHAITDRCSRYLQAGGRQQVLCPWAVCSYRRIALCRIHSTQPIRLQPSSHVAARGVGSSSAHGARQSRIRPGLDI